MKSLFFCAFACFIALSSIGCESEPEFPCAPESAVVHIRNLTGEEIAVVRHRVSGADDKGFEVWSRNLLPDAKMSVLPHAATAEMLMPPATYDIRVEMKNSDVVKGMYGIDVPANTVTEIIVQ